MQTTPFIPTSAPVMLQNQWLAPNLPSSGNMAGMEFQPHHHSLQMIPPPPLPPQHCPNRPSPILFSELVKRMEPEDLALQKQNGYTALCVAAEGGMVDIAKIMLEKNIDFLNLRGNNDMSPLMIASILGHRKMLSYLYSMTDDMRGEGWSAKDRIMLLYYYVNNNIYMDSMKELLKEGNDADAMLPAGKHGSDWLVGRRGQTLGSEITPVTPQPNVGDSEQITQQLEVKFNRKLQDNMAWMLKKLGEANLDMKINIGDFCATVCSDQDEKRTPITPATQTPGT